MHGILALTAFAMACTVLPAVSALSLATCTPQTCPPGPVAAGFEYSNCTGRAIYQQASANEADICAYQFGTGTLLTVEEEYFELRFFYDNPNCSQEGEYSYQATRSTLAFAFQLTR
jgi:hypothetical protein